MQSGVILSGFHRESGVNTSMPMNILVTLTYRNQSGLASLLYELQDPSSPFYHKYLTTHEFISKFSPLLTEYDSYLNYFRNEGMNITDTYSDRLSIAISATAGQVERAFHTNIIFFSSSNGTFYAPDSQLYLSRDLGAISGISGISDEFKAKVYPMFTGSGSGQYLFGADLQTAYQLNMLYQSSGFPTGETVATILWSGTDYGTPVGPFVPSDISTYLTDNLPASEPKSTFYGLPVGGAPLPGSSSQYDTTGANIESTLDLEMAGSTAPGATLVEVYGPQPYLNYLDEAFAEILNPNYNTTLDSALSHVVAISNSWGSNDMYNSAWSQYEQEAAARGITVLVSSGDDGNTNSAYPSFPATVGYDSYGSLAVGGTQTILSGTQSSDGSGTTGISSQSVWYNTPNSGDGSQGGVSTMYSEPSWQLNSPDANGVITGSSSITGIASGRGTPDVAAVGSNMLVYLSSVSGGGTGYYRIWGTSIASPLDAGLIATIDHYMNSPEGFVNSFIYSIGQEQYQGIYAGPPPFYFIHNGSNGAFSTSNGYNLVDGWGSINAYNFVLAQEGTKEVTFTESGLPTGEKWYVNFSGGQSLSSTTSSISILLQDGTYSYTSSVTLPGYSVSNGTFTVSGSSVSILVKFTYSSYNVGFTMVGLPTGSWYINVTGNSLSEDFGSIYSDLGISISLPNGTYEYTVATSYKNYAPSISSGIFTVYGSNLLMSTIIFSPVEYNIGFVEIGLPAGSQWEIGLNGTNYTGSTGTISISLQNGTHHFTALSLSNSSYSSHGGSFTVDGSATTIQVVFKEVTRIYFAETGLPDGGKWSVSLNGVMNSSIAPGEISYTMPNGTYSYYIPGTPGYHPAASAGTIEINGYGQSITVIFVVTTYNAVFTQYGLPSGDSWYVNFTSGPGSYGNLKLTSSGTSVSVNLPNGSYSYAIASSDKRYEAYGSSFTIQGQNDYLWVYFSPVTYSVVFHENGLPSGMSWNLTISGIRYQTSSNMQSIYETNGTFSYTVSGPTGYHPAPTSGEFTLNGEPLSINILFQAYTYNITFSEGNLPNATEWWVNFTNGHSLSSTTNTINCSLSNGTYYFYAGTSNKSWINTNSHFGFGDYELFVDGYSYTYFFSFMLMTYNITIFESGLSPGAQWIGYIPNSYGFYSGTANNLSSFLPNGTYEFNFTAWQNGIEYEPTTINITVNGANATYFVLFHRYYIITFEEIGLPTEQSTYSWGVNFSGANYVGFGVLEVNVSALDGNYRVEPINNTLYYGVLGNPFIKVQGSNLTVTVKYEPYAFITVYVQPQNATVFIDGVQEAVSNGYLNVSVFPGNHSIVVQDRGDVTYYKNTTLAGGMDITLQVDLNSKVSAKASNETSLALIGIAVTVPTVLIAYYFMRKK
ncbi:Pro-kumamolisin, activation domain [Thermoplasmatales archaeon]|nr:Pro-kumamolisin, activation domain [Thermoplasmatales archaeon]